MDARTALLAGLLVLGTYNAWQRWEGRPVHPRDGALAPDEPVQTDIERAAPVRHGRWLLTARASYDITARILSREDYRFDRIADLVPEDLALGWGRCPTTTCWRRSRSHRGRASTAGARAGRYPSRART